MSHVVNLTRANVLLGNKNGRDKLYKTLQYLFKLLIELAHVGTIEHPWLPHIKRFSLRLSQSRALFRLGVWLSDLEKFELLLKERTSWSKFEKLLLCFTVLISNWFDSLACIYGIIRRDTGFSVHYSTLFWLLGIFGDVIRQSRALQQAISAELKWNRDQKIKRIALESDQAPISDSELKIEHIKDSQKENAIGILKSLADSVTALSILYPVTVGRHRLFVCCCGLFAGSVGLIQNWVSIKV